MSDGKIKVGVIGAGDIAKGIHLPSLAAMEDVQVVAVCDLVRERAEKLAAAHRIQRVYVSFREMLAAGGMDAVFVLVEPANLFHVTWSCLDAGLGVFMEKPAGISAYQARSLARKAAEAGRILQVGFNRRHIPLVRRVMERLRERTRITQVEGCFLKFGAAAFDHGSLSAFSSDTVHAIDLMRWMAGGTPVAAALVIGQYDDVVPNAWNGVCRFDNGVTGIIKANYKTGGRIHRFEAHGPGMSAIIDLGFGPPACAAQLLSHAGAERYSLAAKGKADEKVESIDGIALAGSAEFHMYYGYFHEDRHFIDCLRSGAKPETGIDDAVKSMEMVEMLQASAI
jgi:virulence factor